MLNHNIISEIKDSIVEILDSLDKLEKADLNSDILLIDSLYIKLGLIKEKLFLYRSYADQKRFMEIEDKIGKINEVISNSILNTNTNTNAKRSSDCAGSSADYNEDLFEIDLSDEPSQISITDSLDIITPQWMLDRVGYKIEDINSAITLNDKLYFVNELFEGDYDNFKQTIAKLNELSTMDEALNYCRLHFPNWDEFSNEIYRFYMILRRRYL
jgi:hypothetical protein